MLVKRSHFVAPGLPVVTPSAPEFNFVTVFGQKWVLISSHALVDAMTLELQSSLISKLNSGGHVV
jgi:hypothetical protein